MSDALICEEYTPMPVCDADALRFAVNETGTRRIVEQVVAADVRFVVIVVGERVVQGERVERALARIAHAPYVRIVGAEHCAADARLCSAYIVRLNAPLIVCGALLLNVIGEPLYEPVDDVDGCRALPPEQAWPTCTTRDDALLQKMAYAHSRHLMMDARRRGNEALDAACWAVKNNATAAADLTAAVPHWRDLWVGGAARGIECRLEKYDDAEVYFCFMFGAHAQCSIDAALAELATTCKVEDDQQTDRRFVSKQVRWWRLYDGWRPPKRAVFLLPDQLESVLGLGRVVVYGHEYEPELEHARSLARSYPNVHIVNFKPYQRHYCPCVKCE